MDEKAKEELISKKQYLEQYLEQYKNDFDLNKANEDINFYENSIRELTEELEVKKPIFELLNGTNGKIYNDIKIEIQGKDSQLKSMKKRLDELNNNKNIYDSDKEAINKIKDEIEKINQVLK